VVKKHVPLIPSCYSSVTVGPTDTPTVGPTFYDGSNPPEAGEFFVYPSPAKGDHATVSCRLAQAGTVEVRIYNQTGDLVSEKTEAKSPGIQVVPFSLAGFAPGIYYCSVVLKYGLGNPEKLKINKFAVLH